MRKKSLLYPPKKAILYIYEKSNLEYPVLTNFLEYMKKIVSSCPIHSIKMDSITKKFLPSPFVWKSLDLVCFFLPYVQICTWTRTFRLIIFIYIQYLSPGISLLRLYCIFILACIQKYNSASQHDSTNQTSFHTKITTVPQAFSCDCLRGKKRIPNRCSTDFNAIEISLHQIPDGMKCSDSPNTSSSNEINGREDSKQRNINKCQYRDSTIEQMQWRKQQWIGKNCCIYRVSSCIRP